MSWFKFVKMSEGWGHIDTNGFRVDDDPRGDGIEFSVCAIEGQDIGVVVEHHLAERQRTDLGALRTGWLTALVFADVASADRNVAVIDATVAPGADLSRCAFAAACAAFDAGALRVMPVSGAQTPYFTSS